MMPSLPLIPPYILVVDDDSRLRVLLDQYLTHQGFLVTTASSAAGAQAKMAFAHFDLIILDVMMPGESGLSFSRKLRQEGRRTPILMLTAQGEMKDRIIGLESGVDDYLTKPFEPRELALRISAILRRSLPTQYSDSSLRVGPWTFMPSKDTLIQGAESLRLSPAEASLLRALIQVPGVAVSREELASRLGMDGQQSRTIDVHVTRLRRKIEVDPKNPRYLQTVRGEGYILWTQ